MPKNYISTTEAAKRAGVSRQAIRKAIIAKTLPAIRVGRSYAVKEDDLKLYLPKLKAIK